MANPPKQTKKNVNANSSDVSYIRRELADMMPQYELIHDCVKGEVAVKNKGTDYLPKPDPEDNSRENQLRYEDYKRRAVFYNVTKRTLSGLSGQVFDVSPVIEVPTLLDPVIKDINGKGLTAQQLAQEAHAHITAHGRGGLLVDFPTTDGPTTRRQQLDGAIKPTVGFYEAWNVINWRTTVKNNRSVLSLVVLREWVDKPENAINLFNTEQIEQYRVLKLDDDGLYIQEIWQEGDTEFSMKSRIEPRDASGKRLEEIPFTFIGSVNNDPDIDEPPLYDLASLNIAHYRNSADYEESVYINGQPTLAISGLTEKWVNEILSGGVRLGARTALLLPSEGKAEIIQTDPNTMAKDAMEHKERQMVALGAKLVQQTTVQRTATEAGLEEASEASVLQVITRNVSAAFKWALEWCAIFTGAISIASDAKSDTIKFELNTEFNIASATPEEIRITIEMWQKGAISFTEMRETVRKAGLATQDDDKAKIEIQDDEMRAASNEMNNFNDDDENENENNNVSE